MSLKYQNLKKYSVVLDENPEKLIDRSGEVECAMNDLLPDQVTYRIWK